ncbi:MAG: SMI1/KNR4 family protein [Moheibacter sp.]
MNIQYLIKMQNTPKIGHFENNGISESEIEQLEIKMGVKFPKAYKEFLYLGGEYESILQSWNRGFENLEFMQEDAQKTIQEVGLTLRPFWCFAEYDSADSFLFFFLDEGDNPAVYNFLSIEYFEDENGDTIHYKQTHNTFSDCIDGKIDYALNNP